jgi:hypothetical protein
MGRRRRERDAQARDEFMHNFQAASDQERGASIFILWVYAAVTTALYAVFAVVVAVAARRIWRERRSGLASALRAGFSKTLLWVVSAMVIDSQAGRWWVLPAARRRLHVPPGPIGPSASG